MENAYKLLARFQYTSEAIIIKGKLESEGIDVFMADNFTIDTDPLMSNAIGGVKLYIREDEFQKASEIYNSISNYSVDDSGHAIICPECSSGEVMLMSTVRDNKSLLSFLFSVVLLGTLPFYVKYKYHCNSCGNEFKIK